MPSVWFTTDGPLSTQMVKVELMCQIRAVCHTTCMNTLMITTSFDTLIYSLSLTLYLRFNHLLIVIKFPCGFTVKVDIDIWHSHISIRLFANRRETCILISDAISHGVVSPTTKCHGETICTKRLSNQLSTYTSLCRTWFSQR